MWRHHRSKFSVGRTRCRLAKLLTEVIGSPIDPEDLDAAQGYYRQQRSGQAAWSGIIVVDGIKRTICSWDSMTECVRNGFTVQDSRGESGRFADYEIHAKDRRR